MREQNGAVMEAVLSGRWWALPVDEVVDTLDVDPEDGLAESDASARLDLFGPNQLKHRPGPTLVRRFLVQFKDPLVALLLVAIVVSLFAWWSSDESTVPVEAVVIGIIVVANAVIGVWQEGKATRAVEALRQLTAAHATVLRGGHISRLATASLVPGDIVILTEGATVGFDGRLVASASLAVDKAS